MNRLLLSLFAGLTASLLGFLINSRLLKYIGERALVIHIPVVEETAKTMAAVALGAGIVVTHMFFGVVEALYDLYNSPRDYSFTASVFSLISHTLLGAAAYFTLKVSGSVILAVLVPSIMHSLWNRIMTGYTG